MPILFNNGTNIELKNSLWGAKDLVLVVSGIGYKISNVADFKEKLQSCIDFLDKVEHELTVFGEPILWTDVREFTHAKGFTPDCTIVTSANGWKLEPAGKLASLQFVIVELGSLKNAINRFENQVRAELGVYS